MAATVLVRSTAVIACAAGALVGLSPAPAQAAEAATVTVPVGSHGYVTSGAGVTVAAFCGDRTAALVATAPGGTRIVGSYESRRLGAATVDYTTVSIPFDGVTIASGSSDRVTFSLAAAGSPDVLTGAVRLRSTPKGCVVSQ